MTIIIKTSEEIKKIRVACKIAAEVLEMIKSYIKPGISTGKLDYLCHQYIIKKQHAIPSALGYQGFPKATCISVNDVVCHGIPSDYKKLKNGDIVNIDIAVMKDGYHGDTSKMFIVGSPTILGERLCRITRDSLYLAISMLRPGIRLRNLGRAIQKFIKKTNFSIVKDYCGHGIGKNFHEDPQVLHYDADDHGVILQPGMIFTIEPMINSGDPRVRIMKDGWTVKTKDHSLSAQYEHTVCITNEGVEIMTLRDDDQLPEFFKINNN